MTTEDDRLEQAWRKLGADIKQAELELEEQRRRFKILDDARALIVGEASSAESAQRADVLRDSVPSLQEAVLIAVKKFPADIGASPTQIAREVRAMGLGSSSKTNSFYSSVYVTLVRLAEREDIRAFKGEAGRMFAKNEKSGILFNSQQGGAKR